MISRILIIFILFLNVIIIHSQNCPGHVDVDWIKHRTNERSKANIRSVVKISNPSGCACSGVLINNTEMDCKPYILTAAHCGIGDIGECYNEVQVIFNYESSNGRDFRTVNTSNQSPGDGSQTQYLSGVCVRAKSLTVPIDCGSFFGYPIPDIPVGSDYMLLELMSNIPDHFNVHYAGWDINHNSDKLSNAYVIHHPNKLEKRYTHLENTDPSVFSKYLKFNSVLGSIEKGSSGAPLYNINGRVAGLLHRTEGCVTGVSAYNIEKSWNSLKPFLSPNSNETSLRGYDKPCSSCELDVNSVSPNTSVDPAEFNFSGSPSKEYHLYIYDGLNYPDIYIVEPNKTYNLYDYNQGDYAIYLVQKDNQNCRSPIYSVSNINHSYYLTNELPTLKCDVIQNFDFQIGDNVVSYSWDNISGADYYIVEEFYNSNSNLNKTIHVESNSFSKQYSSCQVLYVRVRANCTPEEDFSQYEHIDLSCIDPTCSDGIQNQGETSVDCGGPCQDCGGACPNNCDSSSNCVPSSITASIQGNYGLFDWSIPSNVTSFQICYGTSANSLNNCINTGLNNYYYINLEDNNCPNTIYYRIDTDCGGINKSSSVKSLNTSSADCSLPISHCSPIENVGGYFNCDENKIILLPYVDYGFGTFTLTYYGGTIPITANNPIIIDDFPNCVQTNGSYYQLEYLVTHVEGNCSQIGWLRTQKDFCDPEPAVCESESICDYLIDDNISVTTKCAPQGGYQLEICSNISSNIRIYGLESHNILTNAVQCYTHETIYERGYTLSFIIEYDHLYCNGKTFNITNNTCPTICRDNLLISHANDPLYETSKSIITSGNLSVNNGNMTYLHSTTVSLKPGFHAKSGSVFKAKVDPCN